MDLKAANAQLDDLENLRSELEESTKRKDIDIMNLSSLLDQAKINVENLTNKLKESQVNRKGTHVTSVYNFFICFSKSNKIIFYKNN